MYHTVPPFVGSFSYTIGPITKDDARLFGIIFDNIQDGRLAVRLMYPTVYVSHCNFVTVHRILLILGMLLLPYTWMFAVFLEFHQNPR